MLRPMLRDLVKPHELPHVPGDEDEGEEGGEGGVLYGADGKPIEVPVDSYAEILAQVREFAKLNPKITAEIAKEWMVKE